MLYSQTKHHGKTFSVLTTCMDLSGKDLLDQHRPMCVRYGAQCTKLPSGKDKFMSFKNWGKMLKAPFVIYADFECILSPLQNEKNKTNLYEPCGYSYLVVRMKHKEMLSVTGDDVVEHLFDDMIKESDYLLEHLKTNISMIFTEEDEQVHRDTKNICHPMTKWEIIVILLESTEELHILNATWHLNIPSLFQYFPTIRKDMTLTYS